MAGADIRAGRAFVELYVKNSLLVKGLEDAGKRLTDFGNSAVSLGAKTLAASAAISGPLIVAVKHFMEAGSKLADMSLRTGVSAKALSEFGFVLQQGGSSLEAFEKSIKKMQQSMIEARNGSAGARKEFAALGLDIVTLMELSPDEQFLRIADAISKIESPAERTSAALALLGKSGTELLPMMSGGAAGIEELRQRAVDLGLTIDNEQAEAADTLGDRWDEVKATLGGVANQIGAALAPALTTIFETTGRVVAAVSRWVRANGETVRTIALVAAGLASAGGMLVGFGTAAILLGATLSGIAATLAGIASAVSFLLSPFALVTAAVIAGVAAWLRYSNAGRAMVADITATLGHLFQIASDTVAGISDALVGGDLEMAAKIAWQGVLLAWLDGTQGLRSIWTEAKFFFLEVWQNATTDLATIFTSAWAGIQTGWTMTISFIQSVWDTFATKFANSFNSIQQSIGNGIINAAESIGVVSQDFAQAWRESLNVPIDQDIADRNAASAKKQAEIETDKQKNLAAIERDKAAATESLQGDRARALAALDREKDGEQDAAEAALKTAREQFEMLRGRASLVRESANAEREAGGGFQGEDGLARRSVAFTSFSASAAVAAGFGGGAIDNAAKVAKEQLAEAKKQKDIAARQLETMDRHTQAIERWEMGMRFS